ncbi:peptide chain release factor N(5)-glutamine methyltransferase [Dictyobacter aurantiacus]|uniref:Release factor glutamine methyltransferase n=1 Tax=Dictyobacter aurantiacus TaxID=1936993 RepID=A0A401ZFH4_9CHLR|nr:peptide chain release factor N(5)-glutamine methyltransferase [Dictyobacter aurantiacus]GCE05625.1 release factor glutamine methyltransferase [Dictyobacter aurantiacus]
MTTLREALAQGAQTLARADIQGTRLEAQVLLGEVLGMDRSRLLAYPDQVLTREQEQLYHSYLQRRGAHEPVAYIVGHKGFYGLDFLVDRRVLIPRPETELLVEAALQEIDQRLASGTIPVVADIGTGSGAIPISVAVNEPRLPYIYACDISPEALEVTRQNCERHHVTDRVRLLEGDLLAPLPEVVDVLLANLPYVGEHERSDMTADVVGYEPSLALFSGPHGLDLLYRFCKDAHASGTLKRGGVMLLEIGYQQCEPLTHFLHGLWPQAAIHCQKDYAGWDRLVHVRLP